MIRTAVAALAALAALLACNNSGTGRPAPSPTPSASSTIARHEAMRLLARGDYGAAEVQYRLALETDPDDVRLHYGLGTVLSHLDRTDETRKQFEWVVAHAEPGRDEVVRAQQWLSQLSPAVPATESATAQASTTTDGAASTEARPVGSMKGKTAWPGITPETRPTSLELRLSPEGAGGTPLKLHIRLGSAYTFSKIPAGPYQLVARSHGRELWKRRVVIAADTEAIVDLTPDTSLLTPAEFPGS
jgi:hypothetical protein